MSRRSQIALVLELVRWSRCVVYQSRYLDRPVQSDILQESFLDTMGAWINMLLLRSTGPTKSPVGACATAVESLDSVCDALLTGKAKMAIVGGSDDFQEEMSYDFAKMKATCSTSAELTQDTMDDIRRNLEPNVITRIKEANG
jgi:3-oxoacyl-(acyl-carrier-protein) synthase